ncbi:MAG: class I SAM-dependent methyltransferase, partial [Candidatus Bathyarchaeia archaeon]
ENLRFAVRHPHVTLQHLRSKYRFMKGEPYEWYVTRSKVAYLKTCAKLASFLCCSPTSVTAAYHDLERSGIMKGLAKRYGYETSGMGFGELTVLYLVTRILKPEIIVETGVARGLSSVVLLQALKENGQGFLYSIDLSQNIGDFIPESLKSRWELLTGSSRDQLPKLLEMLGELDLFLHDSEHTYINMSFEFQCAYQYLTEEGIIASHDISVGDGALAFVTFKRIVGG